MKLWISMLWWFTLGGSFPHPDLSCQSQGLNQQPSGHKLGSLTFRPPLSASVVQYFSPLEPSVTYLNTYTHNVFIHITPQHSHTCSLTWPRRNPNLSCKCLPSAITLSPHYHWCFIPSDVISVPQCTVLYCTVCLCINVSVMMSAVLCVINRSWQAVVYAHYTTCICENICQFLCR